MVCCCTLNSYMLYGTFFFLDGSDSSSLSFYLDGGNGLKDNLFLFGIKSLMSVMDTMEREDSTYF